MRNTLILAAMLAAAPFAAHAEGLSYTYVEAGYSRLDPKSDDLDGAYVRGSFAIAPQVFVFAGYTRVTDTQSYSIFGDGSNDLNEKYVSSDAEIGIGYHMELTEKLDFVADAAFQRSDAEVKSNFLGDRQTTKAHANIGQVTAGVRGKPSARTEAWIKGGYFDSNALDEGKFLGVLGGQVNFTRTWGLVAEFQFFEHSNQGWLGVRASF